MNLRTFKNEFLGESYHRCLHESGLEILVYPKKMTVSHAVLAAKYGSVDSCFKAEGDTDFTEVPDGIAHFLEHKLFESDTGEDTFTRFSMTGASANAFTSFPQTDYLFSCTENFYESLEILCDIVTSPYFTNENVSKEQGIIAQEIKMYDDYPENALFYGLMGSMYSRNKVATNIAGTVESISEITPALLYRCYETFYNPSNMVLATCGDVDPEKVFEIADRFFKGKRSGSVERCYPDEEPSVRVSRFEKEFPVSKPLFEIGIKDTDIPADPHEIAKKQYALKIAESVLFGKTGPFFNSLYSSGTISSDLSYGYEINSSFAFGTLSGEASDPDKVFDEFTEYCDTIRREGFPEEDFERIKRALYADAVKAFDSMEEIANSLVWHSLNGYGIFDFCELIPSITYEYALSVFRKVFRDPSFAVSIVRNKQ